MSIQRPRPQPSSFRYFHYALAAAIIILVANLAELLWVSDPQIKQVCTDLISPLLNLGATVCLSAAAYHSFRQSRRLGLAWAVLAGAQLAFTLGDALWALLELGLGESPFPSVADLFYLAYYPLFLLGVFMLPSQPGTTRDLLKKLIDISIVMVAAILVSWNFLIGPLAFLNLAKEPLEFFLSLAYPVGDLLLLWALLVLLYNRANRQEGIPLWILVASVSVQIISDYIFSYQSLTEEYVSGGLGDIGWILAYLLIALAGLAQVALAEQSAKDNFSRHDVVRLFRRIPNLLPYFPYVWLCAAFGLLIINHAHALPMNFETLFGGVALMIGLILVRQIMTLGENHRLNEQLQQALAQVQEQADELSRANRELEAEIIERQHVEEQLAHDALHDGLTGLANRILFMDRLGQAIAYTRLRKDYAFSVVFLDLDQFKVINDSLGHGMGDQLLVALSQRLLKCLRASDTVARLGGDEFVLILESTSNQQTVLATANRIQSELSIPFHLEGHEVYVTASIGVVPNLLGYDRAEDVLRDADIAMYRAKELGKARFEVFNADMRLQAMARLRLENELRHAIDEHEFQVSYQPIYSLENLQVIGFEALLRWNHPTRGPLKPHEFMAVMEEAGFILPVGKWILEEACSQLQRWHVLFPHLRHLTINVNISGRQLAQPLFAEQVQGVLADCGLNPGSLNLEITESMFMIDSSTTNGFFTRLSRLGVHFQIDDFGTGYSSLSYLQRFPVQTIKIDKSFIHKIGKDGKSQELIRAMISLARDLGMDTTAEGVESSLQLQELKKLGCVNAQGYLLSLPMDPAGVVALLGQDPVLA
jgi:diguanylate cyclase (GGDEF)-like protein